MYTFVLIGDDGQSKEATSGTLMKESEHVYALWCSGRVCVEGMLVELKLLKRQDLINVMSNLFKPAADQIVSTVLKLSEVDSSKTNTLAYRPIDDSDQLGNASSLISH